MKNFRKILLHGLSIGALWVCGTVTMWVMELLFRVEFENLVYTGFQAGLLAYLILVLRQMIKDRKKSDSQEKSE